MWEFTSEEMEKIKKRNKIIGAIYIGGVLFCFLIGLILTASKPSLNLNKYTNVSVNGYDKYAKAEMTFDEIEFKREYDRKHSRTVKTFDDMSMFEIIISVFTGVKDEKRSNADYFSSQYISGNFDKDRRIANGDEIMYQWSCDDESALENAGYVLLHQDISYKAENLPTAETFDMFNGLSLSVEGISPYLYANISGTPNAAESANLNFEIDKYYEIANGDKITMKPSMDEDSLIDYCIDNYNKLPASFAKTFDISNYPEYVSDFSQISEETLAQMKAKAEEVYNDIELRYWGDSSSLMYFNYEGYCMATPAYSDHYGNENDVYLVYRVKVNNKERLGNENYNEKNIYYWFIKFSNVYNEGNLSYVDLDYNDYCKDTVCFYSTIDRYWGNTSWNYYGEYSIDNVKEVIANSYAEDYRIASFFEHEEK